MRIALSLFLCIASCFLQYAMCGQCLAEGKMKYSKISDVPQEAWDKLAEKKIYFGHQSVGRNLLDGIQEVISPSKGIKLRIVETQTMPSDGGVFAHSLVGENSKPVSKIEDFVRVIDSSGENAPQVAALKFCYVDANDQVKVQDLIEKYKKDMENLKSRHANVRIVHFTMPLVAQDLTWKIRLKLMIGKEPWELKDSIKRNQYNHLLLKNYTGKELVFDIARFEATAPDGSVATYSYKGEEFLLMQKQYTDDGGHLNKIGRIIIAEQFLLFLINNI